MMVLVLAGCASGGPVTALDDSPAATPVTKVESVPQANPAERSEPAAPAPGNPNTVFFKRGSAMLDDAALTVLRPHAERLRDNPRLVVTLVGHTDHLGSRSFNLAIAEQRTTAVKTKLRELGVPAKQVRQRNYGNEKAAAGCRSEECRARMRRVDLVYPAPRQK
jgi:outer membrane protein OmpA-like peptidoglycan-associated protein